MLTACWQLETYVPSILKITVTKKDVAQLVQVLEPDDYGTAFNSAVRLENSLKLKTQIPIDEILGIERVPPSPAIVIDETKQGKEFERRVFRWRCR